MIDHHNEYLPENDQSPESGGSLSGSGLAESQPADGLTSRPAVSVASVPSSVMIVSGEASGDAHGALLASALRVRDPEIVLFGMGGSDLREAGCETIIDSEAHASVMGLTEILGKLGEIRRAFARLVAEAVKRRPAVVVLIDFPDFNLRLARALKRKGFAVVYFVTPQVWAWRRGRVRAMRRDVTKALPIFPFEESFFHLHGVDAEYVGHPFLDRPPILKSRSEILAALGLDPSRPVVALLPGSRQAELDRLLEPMLSAFARLRQSRPGLQAVLPVAATLCPEEVRKRVGNLSDIAVTEGQAREVLAASDVAVVASGTVTVEAALAGVPFVAVYRLSPFTFAIARRLVRGVRHFAMANLIAGKKVVPELLQNEVTGERIAVELERILGDPGYRGRIIKGLETAKERLTAGRLDGRTAADRAAEVILELAAQRQGGRRRSKREEWELRNRVPPEASGALEKTRSGTHG